MDRDSATVGTLHIGGGAATGWLCGSETAKIIQKLTRSLIHILDPTRGIEPGLCCIELLLIRRHTVSGLEHAQRVALDIAAPIAAVDGVLWKNGR